MNDWILCVLIFLSGSFGVILGISTLILNVGSPSFHWFDFLCGSIGIISGIIALISVTNLAV